ncbi:putative glutenin, high molecular weight subunit DY10-like isoform X1 [Penaeus vannamei]|uniref:Putative glutenin, high molecular weight subunit DY10-like isoform X1 n=1 Tax=Penaeus vannamei TaxID=6689 RepID=A0A3R7SRU1_PENVA|nr:putative glutenin, high molecular weight subunit DY10-like isoform X1 [Penaeus vannamei]
MAAILYGGRRHTSLARVCGRYAIHDAETTMNETTIETPSTPLSAAEGATADATSAVDREQDSSDGEEGGESEGSESEGSESEGSGEEGIEDEGGREEGIEDEGGESEGSGEEGIEDGVESEGSESEGGGEEGIEDEGGESEGSGEEGIEDEGVESEGSESEGGGEEGIEDEGGADEGPENKESLSVVEFPSNLTASHIVWFEKELRVPRGATEMTLCFFVNLMYFQGNQYVVVVMFSNKDGVYFKDGNLMSNFGDNYLKTKQPLAAWTWVHACLVLGRDMALVLDGEQVEVVRAPGGDFPEITSLTLNLPFASGRYSVLPFMGKITLPKVYYRQLSKDEMASLSECGTAPAEDEADGQWRVMSSRGGGVVGTVVAHGAHARFRPSESASGEE